MAELQENNVEWYTGDKVATLSFSQRRHVSKIMKYAESHPEVEIVAKNEDGSICAHIPVSWIKISPPRSGREFTEEEKIQAAERLRIAREKKRTESSEINRE